MEGKSYNSENPKTTFIKKNSHLSCNFKDTVYIGQCTNCNQSNIGCIKAVNDRISLHKSNYKLSDN